MDFLKNIVIPSLDQEVMAQTKRYLEQIDPQDSFGDLNSMIVKYAGMTGKLCPKPPKKRTMLLMVGDHGVAEHGISAFPQEVTVQMSYSYLRGVAGANVLARHANADVVVTDIGVQTDLNQHEGIINKKVAYGTKDFSVGPAMTAEQALAGIRAGFDVANDCMDQGYDCFITAEMGIGNTTSSAAIASAFTGLDALQTVGRGTGIGDNRFALKRKLVSAALEVNKPTQDDPFGILCKVGGYDYAGLVGGMIAASLRRVPTFIDGSNAAAAALIACGMFPAIKNYLFASHLSAEISHAHMLNMLELKPILRMDMRLGEGTGAALAVKLFDLAIEATRKVN